MISGVVVALLIAAVLIAQRVSDGPMGPLSGGRLRAGTLVSELDVDWSFAEGQLIELQLLDPLGSRTTGVILHEGQLFVGCDLGFIWRRAPAPASWMLSLNSRFKRWHKDALRDGRVVLRVAGKRYERQAVRVTDSEILTLLRLRVETAAESSFSAPLREASIDGPGDIWFFRMDPRPAAIHTGLPQRRARESGRPFARASSGALLPAGLTSWVWAARRRPAAISRPSSTAVAPRTPGGRAR